VHKLTTPNQEMRSHPTHVRFRGDSHTCAPDVVLQGARVEAQDSRVTPLHPPGLVQAPPVPAAEEEAAAAPALPAVEAAALAVAINAIAAQLQALVTA
jgi:hypothetical protein